MKDYDEATADTVEIPAAELDTNDIFPSHDGLRHDVDGVSVDGETVYVNVRRSDGSTYSTEFPADHIVRVIA